MESRNSLSSSARRQLDRFCHQYLQLQLHLDYPHDEHLRKERFQQSLNACLFEGNAIQHGPPISYQLRVLKELTKRIEQSIQDWQVDGISDDLVNYMSSLFATSVPSEAIEAQQRSYVTYTLAPLALQHQVIPSVTLLELRNVVAASGTTGLRTWEAALHLGNYLCANPSLVQGKSVLELGTGTGYISVLCVKYLKAAHVVASDGSDDVVANLDTSFYLNGLQGTEKIERRELKWGDALVGDEHPDWNGGRGVDLVLGADVTYDGAAMIALISTVRDLFKRYPHIIVIISAAVRNSATFDKFMDGCQQADFVVKMIDFKITPAKLQDGPFFSDIIPIQLCMITSS